MRRGVLRVPLGFRSSCSLPHALPGRRPGPPISGNARLLVATHGPSGERTQIATDEQIIASPEAVAPATAGWGQLPMLSPVAAYGLLLVATAFTGARQAAMWSEALFFAGLLTLFTPIALRMSSTRASRRERVGLLVIVGMGCYLVKWLQAPTFFTLTDELLHWRTATDILQQGRLFQDNPIHWVGTLYPGLESVTSALCSLGGLPVFGAGVLIIGVARLVLIIALFLTYELASGSSRMAGLATLLYMTNPYFLFFNAQFSYESLALPLAILVTWLAARRARRDAGRMQTTVLLLVALAGVIATHHLTTYALAAFLLLWTAIDLLRRPAHSLGRARIWQITKHRVSRLLSVLGSSRNSAPTTEVGRPGVLALLALVVSLAWLVYVAGMTLGYVAEPLAKAVGDILRVLAGEASGRQMFNNAGKEMVPPWEQLSAYASVLLLLSLLPLGLLAGLRNHRSNALSLAMTIGALAYPASLVLHLSDYGLQVSGRMSEFLFVALAFTIALGIGNTRFSSGSGWRRQAAFAMLTAALLTGGTIMGWPRWERMPGPYLVAANSRSIEPQGLSAARWALDTLGRDNRVLADLTNRGIMGSYGRQWPVSHFHDQVPVSPVLLSKQFTAAEIGILRRVKARYVVVDRRLLKDLPRTGYYVEMGEEGTFKRTEPLDPAALAKFEGLEGVSRVFDSGDIVIYDVGALLDEP